MAQKIITETHEYQPEDDFTLKNGLLFKNNQQSFCPFAPPGYMPTETIEFNKITKQPERKMTFLEQRAICNAKCPHFIKFKAFKKDDPSKIFDAVQTRCVPGRPIIELSEVK